MKNLKVMNNTLFNTSMKQSIKYICMFLMLVGMNGNMWGTTVNVTKGGNPVSEIVIEGDFDEEAWMSGWTDSYTINITSPAQYGSTYWSVDGTGDFADNVEVTIHSSTADSKENYSYSIYHSTDANTYANIYFYYTVASSGNFSGSLDITCYDSEWEETGTLSIPFTIIANAPCSSRTLSFANSDVTQTVAAGTYSQTPTASAGSGTISYELTTDDEGFSINSSTGEVSFTGTGEALITATIAANGDYCDASDSYYLTITNPVYNDYKFACVDPVEAEVTQWTQKDIEVVANIGTANKVVAKMGSTTTGAVSIGTPKTTNTYTFTFNTLDFSEKENKSMILYWRNVSTLTGVSLVTLPSIISLTAGEGGSWDGLAIAPTEDDIVVINEPMTIDVPDAKAKEVVIKGSGSLSVGAGKALVIAEGIHKFDGSVFIPTTESDINIGSTLAEGTGALIIGDHDGTNKATVNFAVKAKKDGSGHWINQFIGTPFNDENAVLYNYYETQLYEFKADGSGTTTSEWTKLKGSDSMEPFMGYNLLRSKTDDHVLWMQGTLNATNTPVEKHLYYNGSSKTENMLANGWVAPIHIDAFEEDDFGGAEAAIYIFNAGTPEDQGSHSTSDGSASNNSPGQYIALPVSSTPWVSPTVTVIPAMQAFSVFATGANQTLTLDYEKLVYNPAQTNVGIVPTRVPRRYRGGEAPEVIRMHVNAESGYNANAYVLGRWDFEKGFDNGWDGRFIEGDEEAPQLYMSTIEGKMVINCVPEIDGTVLDFQRGSADAMYTFTFEYEGDKTWYLNDLKEKKSTRINGENNYTFYSENYDSRSRFVISSLPVNTATGFDRTQGDNVAETKARKIMVNGLLYIIRGGQIYDATGAIVK